MQYGPPQPYAPPAPPKKKTSCLVIALIVGAVGFLLLGPLAAMAIYGVRRYLSAAKTSEAKNTIGAIARGAKLSYERESVASDLIADPSPLGAKHTLCESAIPVPAVVPAGVKYQPGRGGVDFDTGDATTGWKCLKFAMTMPMYYQYSYTKGSSPISAARGGPTVSGAESFEAAAQGDLDGDHETSAFTIVGQTDAAGELRVGTQIFIADEAE